MQAPSPSTNVLTVNTKAKLQFQSIKQLRDPSLLIITIEKTVSTHMLMYETNLTHEDGYPSNNYILRLITHEDEHPPNNF